jgi:hypothetical protein
MLPLPGMKAKVSANADPPNAEPGTPNLGKEPPRKPYERPRILSREPLEAMAATCTANARGKPNARVCGVAKS